MTSSRPSVAPTAFDKIDTWVFDLDNTLYPADSDLWPKIDQRITLWIMQAYGIDGLSARALQKFYYERYGTTLRGLMEADPTEAGLMEPSAFLGFVHDIDRSSIIPNPGLAAAIGALAGRKLILTNGSRMHALETIKALGLDGLFEDVFDIVAGGLVPKPEPGAYQRFVARHAIDPTRAVMIEDIPRNLVVPKTLGMITVLVVPPPGSLDTREAFERVSDAVPDYVDHVTDDLAGFLTAHSVFA